MAFTVPFKSFNGGEISPDIGARTDQAKYQAGLATCRNFFPRLEGSATNRSGTGFICPLMRFSSGAARLIPFIFNDDQAYQLLVHWTGTETRFLVLKNSFPVLIEPGFGVSFDIVSITSATPPVATTPDPHSFTDGALVYLAPVSTSQSPSYDGRWVQAKNVTATTFELWEEAAIVGNSYSYVVGSIRPRQAYSVLVPGITAAHIPTMRYTQSADTITVVGADFPPFEIKRLADDNWTVATIVFDPSIAQPDGGAIAVAVGSVTLRYRVTTIDAETSEESFPGYMADVANPSITLNGTSTPYLITKAAHGFFTGDEVYFHGTLSGQVNDKIFKITVTGANTFTLDGTNDGGFAVVYAPFGFMQRTAITIHTAVFPTALNTAVLTWPPIAAAGGYNVYRETNGVYSYIGTSVGPKFEDAGYTADSLNTPPIPLDRFNAINKYPGAVGYYQQRLVVGGPNENPEEVSASRTGTFHNFTRSNPTQADDSIRWIMASGQVNQVRHLADVGKLLVFTQGAVFSTEGDDAGTLRPTAINPRKRADYGIGDVAPLTIGQIAMYVQASGKIVREMEPNSFGVYASRDITSFAKHLFEIGEIVSWSYAEEPFSIIWCVRSDGVMLGLTYLKEHQVDGWHRHDTGNGDQFLDVSCVPENGESATYVLVRRFNCNGKTRVYCERMATRTVFTPSAGRFLDCYTVLSVVTPTNIVASLWHLNGRSVMVLGDGEVMGPFTVTGGKITLPVTVTTAVVGLQIIAELKTLEPDNQQGETWADKTKAMAELTLKVRNTLGIAVGLSESTLQKFNDRWCTPGKFVDGSLYTGKLQIINRASVTEDGTVFVRQDQPLPCTVLGIYARLEIGEV